MAFRCHGRADADLKIVSCQRDDTFLHLDADALQCRDGGFCRDCLGDMRDGIAQLVFITDKLHGSAPLLSGLGFAFDISTTAQRQAATAGGNGSIDLLEINSSSSRGG
jgi:hypothetical protein